jgi:DNA replication licensing factor MCM7
MSDQRISSRHYIAKARQKRPTVPRQVSNYVVDSYVRLRKLSKDEEAENKSHTYTSARTLLGILRLAQALARLRWSDYVERFDVDEALRLMECSKESLTDEEDGEHEVDRSVDESDRPIDQVHGWSSTHERREEIWKRSRR